MQKERCLLGCLDAKAFTLIELLVVVLIIGILAAVAVPQYNLAVDKSRCASLLPMIMSIDKAQKAYYLANGQYTIDFDELGIDPGGTPDAINNRLRHYGNARCWVYGAGFHCQPINGPELEKDYENDFLICWHNGNSRLEKICKSLQKTPAGCNYGDGKWCRVNL